jgi:hypothetical protein
MGQWGLGLCAPCAPVRGADMWAQGSSCQTPRESTAYVRGARAAW